MKIRNCPPEADPPLAEKLKILLASLVFLSFAFTADAALIIQAPPYLGLNSGLVGYWSFDGPDMAKNTAYDRSSQGNNGTLTNGPVRAAGKIGQALEFDGDNDYVDLGDPSSLQITGAMTISVWVNQDSASANDHIYTRSGGSTDLGVRLWISNSNDKANFRVAFNATTDSASASTNAIPRNQWAHIVAVYVPSVALYIYQNGILEGSLCSSGCITTGTVPDSANLSTAGPDIGQRGSSAGRYNGKIDDVRIYNRVLPPDEIKRLYNIGATLKINTSRKDTLNSGLVGYWSFDGPDMASGNSRTTAYDRSRQGNNGVAVNMATSTMRVAGKIGQALEFGGTTANVNLGSGTSLDNLSAMTVSAWIKAGPGDRCGSEGTGANNIGGIVVKGTGTGDSTAGWRLVCNDTTGTPENQLEFSVDYATTDLSVFSANNKITTDGSTWQHIAARWDGTASASGAELYINGALVTDSRTDPVGGRGDDNAAGVFIGNAGNQSGVFTFLGPIDDVRIYDRVLSADEIKRLYNIGATLKINTSRKDTLNSGLVGYWSFDGPDMASGNSRTTAYDRSRQGNNGVAVNMATSTMRVAGKIGQALEFDGANDYVDIGNPTVLQLTGSATWAAWIKLDNISDTRVFLSKQAGSNARGWQVYGYDPSGGWVFVADLGTDAGADTLERRGSTVPSTETWYHVTAVYDAANLTFDLYLNGVLDNGTLTCTGTACSSSVPASQVNSAQNVNIGRKLNNLQFADGPIDDVRVYNRALSADEVKRLYIMGR